MKNLIAVVDANGQHRTLVAEALNQFYSVHPYETSVNAISGMHIAHPKLILVGQRVGASMGISFIRELRKERFLSDIPVLLVIDNEDFRTIDQIRELGIKDYLVKPYQRSKLISLITNMVNGRVERAWQDLPLSQRKALEGTLGVFNSVIDDIASGNPLAYGAINQSCAALVESVTTKEDTGELLNRIKDHDNFTYVHSLRFATLISLFGKGIGLPKEQQILVAGGGMLHDIGKMLIPRALLNKQGPLNPAEWKIMRGHVANSQKILASSQSIPKGIQVIVTQHHERLDGSGYPLGLKAPELNELARTAAIIDVFCALTDRRSYKRTVPAHVALETMGNDMKGQLDQEMLIRFKEILLDSVDFGEKPDQAA